VAWGIDTGTELAVGAPAPDVDGHGFHEEGRIQINCTGWPGISFTTTEYGNVIRDGHRFRVVVRGEGDLRLLQSRLARGGEGRKPDVEADEITRIYDWPQVREADELQTDVDGFLNDLRTGAAELAERIQERNAELALLATRTLAERQQKIRESRTYLGGL